MSTCPLSRRRLVASGLGAIGSLLVACAGSTRLQTPVPATEPQVAATEPRRPAQPVETATPIAPYPAAPIDVARSPIASATSLRLRRGVFLPNIGQTLPTPIPPTATLAPATATRTTAQTGPPGTPRPTDTPRPTPPPEPTPGPRVPITKVTKWGLGVYRESNEIFDDLYVAKPTVILLMDPTAAWARRIRDTFPKAFIVGRRFFTEVRQPLDNPGPRGTAFADLVADHAVPLKGVVDAWMSYNEALGGQPSDDYKRYNEFQVTFAQRLQGTHGIAAIAANDGSGAIDPANYPKYFADAIRASKYFGVHAYSPPASNSMKLDAEWNALRYRKINAELTRAGIRNVTMVITESGLGDGWLNRVDDVRMVEDFFWFTDELEKDPYMLGHASYGLFGVAGQEWRHFDMRGTDILNRMGYYEPPSRRPPPTR